MWGSKVMITSRFAPLGQLLSPLGQEIRHPAPGVEVRFYAGMTFRIRSPPSPGTTQIWFVLLILDMGALKQSGNK